MIPPFTPSGALPPFLGSDATARAGTSPYATTATELLSVLGTTPERKRLLSGLFAYRDALRSAGVVDGFQLIDGSFTEDCEALRGRPPDDIDLVTYAKLPVARADAFAFLQANKPLLDPGAVKAQYSCHAFFLDLGKPPEMLVHDSNYFFGLFSHQRVTALWKGMLLLPLVSDDVVATVTLTLGP